VRSLIADKGEESIAIDEGHPCVSAEVPLECSDVALIRPDRVR
jgi:hypothetical protein